MTVALITPNWRWDDSPLAADTLRPPVAPPLEWAYLAAGLGSELSAVVDAYSGDASLEDACRSLMDVGPSLVVISTAPSLLYWRCPPFSLQAVAQLVTHLRAAGFDGSTLLVGPHGTHSPEWTMTKVEATAAWRGSSDVALAPCILAGTWQESPHTYVRGSSRPTHVAVDPASALPVGDFSWTAPSFMYRPHMWLGSPEEVDRTAMIRAGTIAEVSRGCPWACFYCAKGPVREHYGRRPIERIRAELRQLKGAGWEYIYFIDETFNLPSDHLYQVLDELRDLELAFGFQGRPDLIDRDLANRLADSGCVYAELGVDLVGDQLSGVMGRRQGLVRAAEGLDITRSRIPIVRYNRLNATTNDYAEMYPEERVADWDVPADPIFPYPGTRLGADLMRKYGREGFDWDFAERYSWWLRLEVYLQRHHPELERTQVAGLQRSFLSLAPNRARLVATLLDGAKVDPEFHEKNRAVFGVGGNLHIRHSGQG